MKKLMLWLMLIGALTACTASSEPAGGYMPTEGRPGFLYFYTEG